MTDGPIEGRQLIVTVLTFAGFVMLALSTAIWMGYFPFVDQSVKPTIVAVVFVAGLIDLAMALYFKNRNR